MSEKGTEGGTSDERIALTSKPGLLRTCLRCRHEECPCCDGWCDVLLPDEGDLRDSEEDLDRLYESEGLQTYECRAGDPKQTWTVTVFQTPEDSVCCCGGKCEYDQQRDPEFDIFMKKVMALVPCHITSDREGRIIARNFFEDEVSKESEGR